MMTLVYGLIPARSGSKGLPDKNILEIGGHPLIGYSIAFAHLLHVDRVLISTDSQRYADIAIRYGAECPYLRGTRASSDVAMEEDILADLNTELPIRGIPMPDLWVWLKPTCPFRSVGLTQQGIDALSADHTLDSVRLVTESDARIQRINEDGFLEPLLPAWDPRRSKMRRSEFPTVYKPFNLEIFRHLGWKERGSSFMGTRVKPILCPKITGLDIDDRDDFEIMKALIECRPRPKTVAQHVHLD